MSATANVYSPSANTVAIRTAGVDQIKVDASGNLTMGTSNSTIYVPTANTIGFKAGGNNIVRMTSSGVSINETTPSQAVLEIAPLTANGTAISVKSAVGDSNGLKFSMDSAGVGYINAGYSVSDMVFQLAGAEKMRIKRITDGAGGGFLQLANGVAIGAARYNFNPGGGSVSYTAQFNLPIGYGTWEISVYAYRNVGGQYGTYLGVWYAHGLDGYPYANWGVTPQQVVSSTMNQTSGGPTLTSFTGASAGTLSLTLGNYPGGITVVCRKMTDGTSY
jgi:hypothetical protein